MITDEALDALERRYLPADQQKCVVCGAPLTFAASGLGGSVFSCSSDDASPVRSTRPLRERLDHYAASTWYDRGQADMAVVALVRAYRELAPRAACPCFDDPAEAALRKDAADFAAEAENLDVTGFVARTLDAIGAVADNTGDTDRWEDPRDTCGGETDG